MFYFIANAIFVGAIYLGWFAPEPSASWQISAMAMAWITAIPVILVGFIKFDNLVDIYVAGKEKTMKVWASNVDVVFDIGVTIAFIFASAYVTALLYAAHIVIASSARNNARKRIVGAEA